MNPLADHTEFTAQSFKSLTLPAAEVAGREFDACTFSRCDFHEAKFTGCRFRDCKFVGCDLNGIGLEGCAFSETRFEDCRLVGVNWIESAWAKGRFLVPVSFHECAINHSLFVGLDMRGVTISRCSAREADFSEANLTKADCAGTDFHSARFWHTDLTEADFRGATNYTIPANLNTLKRTKFSLPEALSLLYSLDVIIADAGE